MSSPSDAQQPFVFDHVGFITPDIERSIAFWTEVMGFEARPIGERRKDWIATFLGVPGAQLRLVHLFGHGAHLEFIQFIVAEGEPIDAGVNSPGVAHVCLRVPDAATVRDRIIAAGGKEQGRLVAITEGIAEGLRGLYLRDPHGILIELVESEKA